MKDTLTIIIKGMPWKLIFGLPVKGLSRLQVDHDFEVNFKRMSLTLNYPISPAWVQPESQ
jgi:hypothetical protein